MKSRFDHVYRARFRPQKRRWCYAQPPHIYEVAPCSCGNNRCQWSEWRHMLWCEVCRKDFVPEHNGIFDGPIPMYAANMMGIYFHRLDLRRRGRVIFQDDYLQRGAALPASSGVAGSKRRSGNTGRERKVAPLSNER